MDAKKVITATDIKYSGSLLQALNDQRMQGLFCDVTVIVEDRKFRAHKNILSACSTYFYQLFCVSGQVVEINFVKADIFAEILNYIYTAKVVCLKHDMVEELTRSGQLLGVPFIAELGIPMSHVTSMAAGGKDGIIDLSSADPNEHEHQKYVRPSAIKSTDEDKPVVTEELTLCGEEAKAKKKGSSSKNEDSEDDVILFPEMPTKKPTSSTKTEAVQKQTPSPNDQSLNSEKNASIHDHVIQNRPLLNQSVQNTQSSNQLVLNTQPLELPDESAKPTTPPEQNTQSITTTTDKNTQPTTPPVQNTQLTTSPVENTLPTTPSVENTRPTTPPVENTRPTTPPVENTRPTTPPVENTRPTTPPIKNSRPTTPPVQNSRPTTPSVQNTQPSTPSVQNTQPSTLPVQNTQPSTLPVQNTQPPTPPVQNTQPTSSVQSTHPPTLHVQITEPPNPLVQNTQPSTQPIQNSPTSNKSVQNIQPFNHPDIPHSSQKVQNTQPSNQLPVSIGINSVAQHTDKLLVLSGENKVSSRAITQNPISHSSPPWPTMTRASMEYPKLIQSGNLLPKTEIILGGNCIAGPVSNVMQQKTISFDGSIVQKKLMMPFSQNSSKPGELKIKFSDVASGSRRESHKESELTRRMDGKKIITLDKTSEIEGLSTGCKVYANIGEDTYDIVIPIKDEPDEGLSKTDDDGFPNQKRMKMKDDDHYELIVDGRVYYICIVCKRSYVCLKSLRRHFNVHSWEKKYPCRYCERVFPLAEYRTKHEINHTGERRYQCLTCGSTFRNYHLTSSHIKSVHSLDPSGDSKLYRLNPCKSLQLRHPGYVNDSPNNIPVISDGGIVYDIDPDKPQPASEETTSTPTAPPKPVNWDSIFLHQNNRNVSDGSTEFEFIIPESY